MLESTEVTSDNEIMVKDDSAIEMDKNQYEAPANTNERAEAIAGIRRGLESMKNGGGKTSKSFFKTFFARQDIDDE
jgi:hypothetical protein